MTGCGSFTGVGCQSPVLAPGTSIHGPVVPHVVITTHQALSGGLAFTGADIFTIGAIGVVTVVVGLLAMVSGHRAKGQI